MRTLGTAALHTTLGALALVLGACDGPLTPGLTVLRAPDADSFPAVADALQPTCGTLDCHGQPARNLRLYGGRGLRLDRGANPADDPTTAAEYRATYRSIVGLEPEALDEVMGGRDPEGLSLIRKARGDERHKGGLQMLRGDPLDLCLTTWLQFQTDVDACVRVSRAARPQAVTP